jgi:beta-glucosidase
MPTVTQLEDDVFATEKVLLAQLSLERKIRLLTGATHWSVHSDETIGLRQMVVSDGPAGVRGVRFRIDSPVSSLPAPIALGATWDAGLVHDVAAALGDEARALGVDVLLAPNLNLVRTPLGGRACECFSEDPWLVAGIAAAYIRGVQDVGVASCVKHFVGNESETERKIYDARIDEPTLRELYLVPFEVCVREANPAMIMAGYNSVNGFTMTANRPLLRDLLKNEWGYRGVVISDWTATRHTEESALAGLDLVMPGPDGPWGDSLLAAVEAGRVSVAEIDDKVLRLLRLARRVGALGAPEKASQESVSAADWVSSAPRRVDPALLRQVAERSFVLLRNRGDALPLEGDARRRIAVVGPNAAWPRTQGGGSAMVLPVRRPGLVDALRSAAPDAAVELHPGCRPWGSVPEAEEGTLHDPVGGETGVRLTVLSEDGDLLYDARYERNAVTWWDDLPDAVHAGASSIFIRGRYRPAVSGPHLISAAGLGRMAISLDGRRIAEATTLAPPELVGLLARHPELRVPVDLEAGREIEVLIENHLPSSLEAGREVEARPGAEAPGASAASHEVSGSVDQTSHSASVGQPGAGAPSEAPPTARRHGPRLVIFRLGIAAAPDEEAMIAEAVEAAGRSTAAVVVVGSAESTESEGYDRDSLALPGRQDELVRRVAAANPRTVVVVNSGSPVLMPWADEVAAVLQVWLPGQAMGEAIANVLLGVAEPGGRLPVTVPRREDDCPVLTAEPHFGRLEYSEGLLVGYRGYDRAGTEPLFCFGHGLGYTDWEYLALRPAAGELRAGEDLSVAVTVRNIGGRSGREIVQLYLEPVPDAGDPARPQRALAAFAPVEAAPGEEVTVSLSVPSRAFARFDESAHGWTWPAAGWRLRAGRSSRDLRLSEPVKVS